MNHQRSRTNHRTFPPLAAAVLVIGIALSLVPAAQARNSRVIDLPASRNAADPRLAMSDTGAYAITWRQQPTFGENERIYVQSGSLKRPFRAKPISPGLTKNLVGPLATIAGQYRDGLAWISGAGANAGVRFAGPRSTRTRTVAWIEEATRVIVAKISKSGQMLSIVTAHTEQSTAELIGASVRVDGLGNPTVTWSRTASGCSATPEVEQECFPAAVLAATADATGAFGPPQVVAVDCEASQLLEGFFGEATLVAKCGSRLKYAYRAAGQAFSEPVELPLVETQEVGRFSIGLWRGNQFVVAYETANSFDAQRVSANLVLASGALGQPLGPPKVVRSSIRYDSSNNPQPTPKLVTTRGGRAFLRWLQGDRTRLALIKNPQRLGSAVVVPGFDRRALNTMDAEVAISEQGRALAVWNFISIKTSPAVRAVTFSAPRR